MLPSSIVPFHPCTLGQAPKNMVCVCFLSLTMETGQLWTEIDKLIFWSSLKGVTRRLLTVDD